ncbi:hypothetical protein ACIQ9P_03625 [Kitasatospora sp. NPDC094019]|uniref:hypothetical protein n=1 Tax=Kitasatospora sp. NPDC094019 TaxID=3364091 RepID=UPI00381B24AE
MTVVIITSPASALAEELAFVPEHHLPAVVVLIVGHDASPELVLDAANLLEHAITVSWAHRLPDMRRFTLDHYLDLAQHFHYDDLFHEALRLRGDLRHVDFLATTVERHLLTTLQQHR